MKKAANKQAETTAMARTTMRVPRELLRRIKISAASNSTTLQALLIRVLSEHCDKEGIR